MLFTGEYEHTIDSKQRLAIPADLRTRMDRSGMTAAFYLVPMPDGTIRLWPEDTFERLADVLEKTLLPGEDLQEFDATTFPQTRHSPLDSAGRIRLPEEMLSECGLGSTVMILGVRDHLVLCDPATYRGQREKRRARYAEIMQRARQAMSGGGTKSGQAGGREGTDAGSSL